MEKWVKMKNSKEHLTRFSKSKSKKVSIFSGMSPDKYTFHTISQRSWQTPWFDRKPKSMACKENVNNRRIMRNGGV